MRCEHKANTSLIETNVLFRDGTSARCECGVTFPAIVGLVNEETDEEIRLVGFSPLSSAFINSFTVNCILVITRCPLELVT